MSVVVDEFAAALAAARVAAISLRASIPTTGLLTDDQLLDAQRSLADIRRSVDSSASRVAGEIGERSRRELGHKGLAQRLGFRTPEALVQHTTGSTAREASTLVRVGTLVHDSLNNPIPPDGAPADEALPGPQEPWLVAVAAAVATGTQSLDAATAIRAGLGVPLPDADDGSAGDGGGVGADAVAEVADALLSESPTLDADQLLRRSRQLRDELDAAGTALRERAIRAARSVRRVRRSNGLSRFIIDPDLESAAFWDDVYDKLTSPRRGGPRFVDETDIKWAEAIATDERTTAQYVHDAVTQLLRIAVASENTDARKIIGSRKPAVRVLVTSKALGSAEPRNPAPVRVVATGRTAVTTSAPSRVALKRIARRTNTRGTVASRALTFPWQSNRSNGSPASPALCTSNSTTTAGLSTSDANNASSPCGNASLSLRATEDAGGPTATDPRRGRRLTMSNTGFATTAEPTSPTEFCSAAITTRFCTTITGTSIATPMDSGLCRPRQSTRTAPRASSPARVRH